MTSVFLSYARADADVARAVHSDLEKGGYAVWVDWRDIPPTSDWFEQVVDGIRGSDVFVFVMTPSSLGSEVCARELEQAVAMGKRLIPVRAGNLGQRVVPEALAKRQWVELRRTGGSSLATAVARDPGRDQAHNKWLRLAERWESRGRERSSLLRGAELRDAERWLEAEQDNESDPTPTPGQLEYVLASQQEQGRRQRRLVAGAVAGCAIAIALAAFAVIQRQEAVSQARTARSQSLAANSLVALPTDPAEGLRLASKGVAVQPTDAAVDALREALVRTRLRSVSDAKSGPLTDVRFSRNGSRLFVGGSDGIARSFPVAESLGKPAESRRRERAIADMAIDPATEHLAVISTDGRGGDGEVPLLDPDTMEDQKSFVDRDEVRLTDVEFSPDGKRVASAAFVSGAVRIWETDRGAESEITIPRAPVEQISFSPDSGSLLVVGQRTTPEIFDATTGKVKTSLAKQTRQPLFTVALYDSTGSRVLTGGRGDSGDEQGGGSAHLSDPRSGDTVARLGRLRGVTDGAFSPKGDLVAVGASDGTASVWRAVDGSQVSELTGHADKVSDVEFGPDGRSVFTASTDGTARAWDAVTGRETAVFQGHKGGVVSLSLSPTGSLLATAGLDGDVRLWAAAATGGSFPERETDTIPTSVVAVADSAASFLLADSESAAILDRNLTPVAVKRDPLAPEEAVVHAAGERSPILATVQPVDQETRVRLYPARGGSSSPDSLESAKPGASTLYPQAIGPAVGAFSPDDTRLALAGGVDSPEVVLVEKAGDGLKTRSLGKVSAAKSDGGGVVGQVDFSANGRFLAASSTDGLVAIWQVESGKKVATLRFAQPWVGMDQESSVELSFDGSLAVVSGPREPAPQLWDVQAEEPIASLRSTGGYAMGSSFAPGDAFIATSHRDGTTRIWKPDGSRELARLKPRRGGKFLTFSQPLFAQGAVVSVFDDRRTRFDCEVCAAPENLLTLAQKRLAGIERG